MRQFVRMLLLRMGLLYRVDSLINARRRKKFTPVIGSELEAIVVSPGGVGTTMLMEHMAKFKQVNSAGDEDGLKHLPQVPPSVQEVPVVFLTESPEIAIQSLASRKFLDANAVKLGSLLYFLVPHSFQNLFMRRAISRQERNWMNSEANVMRVSYGDLWERLPEIAEHLGVTDPSFVSSFPPQKPRTSGS